jgi:geranylgeranyl diphosphate synthase type I
MTDYLKQYSDLMLPVIETELGKMVRNIEKQEFKELYQMLAYHLGWEIPGFQSGKQGKRIRPLILLIVTAAANARWEKALPAAIAVELVHNFSLIHDDIEDNSPYRRGKPSIWKIWGIPQALNTGDAMFALANMAIHDLSESIPLDQTLKASHILITTCFKLTQGQYLDISYEKRPYIEFDEYWNMIAHKTAALISACTELGALIAGVDDSTGAHYRQFGYELGIAYQIQDDILGIWGQAAQTGKSTDSDLVEGKKSLPILFGLKHNDAFSQRWLQGSITEDEVQHIAQELKDEGAQLFCEQLVQEHTENALMELVKANPNFEGKEALKSLTLQMLARNS